MDAAIKRVAQSIEQLKQDAFVLLQEMVRIDSTNPEFIGIKREDVIGGESRCSRLVGGFLAGHGFELHEVAVDSERVNVVAMAKGAGGGRSLIINGHVDTVAPFRPDQWLSGSPWTPLIKNGRLYGLGATDMAGGLVAGALAAAAIANAGIVLKGDLQVHAVVGEETGSHLLGTTAVLDAGFTADAAIVPEPSSWPQPLSVAPTSPGSLSLWLSVRGHGSHVGNRADAIHARHPDAGASAGVNAVEKLIIIINALQSLEREWGFTKQNPAFAPGQFTMTPAVISGDVGIPSIGYMADRAEVGYLVWYPPDETPEDIKAEIETYVAHAAALDPWLRNNPPELEWRRNWPAARTPADHPLVKALVEERSVVMPDSQHHGPYAFNAVSDATWLEEKGIPTVVFGPGNLRVAHSIDEHIELAEIVDAARIMARAILRWCGEAGTVGG